MRVPTNSEFIAKLHPAIRTETQQLIELAESTLLPVNLGISITYSLRTINEQNTLYAQGRTKPGAIVTNARGGTSFHNYGLAIDFCWAYADSTGRFVVSDKTAWAVGPLHHKVTGLFKSKGWTWGGDWISIKDQPHLEKKFGYAENCYGLYKKYTAKDFIPNTIYVNL